MAQDTEAVKSKVREFFGRLVSELQSRERALLEMVDHYAKVKREKLTIRNAQTRIETQRQEASAELLTAKESVKSETIDDGLCSAMHRSPLHQTYADTFVMFKETQLLVPATLGQLVLCRRNPETGGVANICSFVQMDDMKNIQQDLAMEEVPKIEETKTLAPAPPHAVCGGRLEESLHSKKGATVIKRRAKTISSEDNHYDTLPPWRSSTVPGLATPRRNKPYFLQPDRVIDLCKANAHVSGILCTQIFGNLVVTDTSNKCVMILDGGEVIHTIGAPEFNFAKPVALAMDNTNKLYVLDQERKKFRLNGDCLFSFPTKPRKTPEKPWDIAVSPNDNTIYISDWSRRRVYVYNGQNGKKIRSIKGCYRRGKKDEFVEFSRPAGITFDLGGRLMIADRGERCVWCINTEGDELIKTIGDGHIQDPYGIAVAKDGKIVVSESESDCVSVFGDDGELLHYFGGTGTEEGQLCRPNHVFVDSNMKIYVADTQNKRVQIFSLPEEGLYQN